MRVGGRKKRNWGKRKEDKKGIQGKEDGKSKKKEGERVL
jgi:hypothetical protein